TTPPSLRATVAAETGPRESRLPHFASIGNRLATVGSGFLGMHVAPFVVANASQMPGNVALPPGVTSGRFNRRLDLLKDLDQEFADAGGGVRVEDHRSLYGSAAQLVRSPRLDA